MEQIIMKQCPKCKAEIQENVYFCSNCGQPLRPRSEDVSVLKQILVYFVSFFLAPFGLGFAFKYLKQPDKKSKTIGIISLVLTFLAIIAVIWLGASYVEQEYSAIKLINTGGL
jgi:uncharacterized membrane protein YvbJ